MKADLSKAWQAIGDTFWIIPAAIIGAALALVALAGIGKPEPLRGPLAGWWRINEEHRLVYCAIDDGLLIAQRRFRY